jgi:hypothetical protein
MAEETWDKDGTGIDSSSSGLLAIVGPKFPLVLRRAVRLIAHYFHREMHFDFL